VDNVTHTAMGFVLAATGIRPPVADWVFIVDLFYLAILLVPLPAFPAVPERSRAAGP
jgi:hypothetical protein